MKKIIFIILVIVPFLSGCQKDLNDLIGKTFTINPGGCVKDIYIDFRYIDDSYGYWGTNYVYSTYTNPMTLKCSGMGTYRVEGKYVWFSENSSPCGCGQELENKKIPISKFKFGTKTR